MLESKFQKFNHLKLHTQYSICEGAIKIDEIKELSSSSPKTLATVIENWLSEDAPDEAVEEPTKEAEDELVGELS